MNKGVKKQILEAIETHKAILAEFESGGVEIIAAIAEIITKAIKQGGCIYICGNGGSAADAQHIAGELIGRFKKERKALPAVALSTDASVITSIANDYSFDKVFARQVEALAKKDDILWAISTSGNSANVLAAAQMAKKKGASVLAFTGKVNSKLEQVADICFYVESETSFRCQEIHQIAYHIICDIVEQNFCE